MEERKSFWEEQKLTRYAAAFFIKRQPGSGRARVVHEERILIMFNCKNFHPLRTIFFEKETIFISAQSFAT